jgi:hypothetical protein
MKMNSIIEEKNEGMKIFIPKIFSPKQAESEKVRRVSGSWQAIFKLMFC